MPKLEDVLSKLLLLKRITEGVPSRRRLLGPGRKAPSRWAIFVIFLQKRVILIPLDHISHVFRAI